MPMLTKRLPKHWRIQESQPGLYDVSVDDSTKYSGKPAVLIQSETATYDDRLFFNQAIDGRNWYGKRVRFSCQVKTENVAAYATIAVSIQESHGNLIVYDPMIDRALIGTNEWTELFVVVDVPKDGRWIVFGPALWGKGRLWAANFDVQEVSKDVPRTDDHGGTTRVSPPVNLDFRRSSDSSDVANGHRLAVGWNCPDNSNDEKYSIEENAFKGSNAVGIELTHPVPIQDDENVPFGYFCQTFNAKPFRGSRIKFSAQIKTENVVGAAYLVLMVNSVYTRLALSTGHIEGLHGNTDWKECSRVLDVSEFAYTVSLWLQMSGSGKAYFTDVKVDSVSDDVPTTDKNHSPRNLDFSE